MGGSSDQIEFQPKLTARVEKAPSKFWKGEEGWISRQEV